MASRGGRERYRRDYPPRAEEKGHHGRSNPPSRHLWVGNLSHNLTEDALAHHFLQFGDLETVSFQPGRSYAFINYKHDKDAFAAIRELQGFVLAGNPLKIEFTKAEKSSAPPRSEFVQHRDQQRSFVRRSPISQRDSGVRYSSPDPPYLDKPKSSDQSTEPSEVLWIGFPAQLKVDEFLLRKAFSQFGEIEKISAFPGRTYAFVRFRNVVSASRAKDALQGKLFGNPRVHICFARNDSGTSNRERNLFNDRPSSHFHEDRHYDDIAEDRSIRSRFVSDFEPSDPHDIGFGRKEDLWRDGNGDFEQRRFLEVRSGRGPPENVYEPRNTSLRDRGPPLRDRGPPPRDRGPPPRDRSAPPRDRDAHFRNYSPPHPHPHHPGGPFYDDDPWDLPEDVSLFHEAKKLKTSDNELPEYPFSALEKSQRIPSRVYPEHPQPDAYNMTRETGPRRYKPNEDRVMNSSHPYGERSDHLNVSYDKFETSSGSLPSKPDWKRPTSESQRNKEWKWEGTIAKGGTPVCRARCFPVGKMMEMTLPEFIDCTARTSLEMLAKHYYQAASAWVVFFVPANDADISYYNEFMNYLGDKQRAAVAKLDDATTLFLVPPSDFSEKVLKVPGRLSVSGVVLKLDQSSSSYGSLHQQPEKNENNLTSFHRNTSPSGHYSSVPPNLPENFSQIVSPASYSGSAHTVGNAYESSNRDRHEYFHRQESAPLRSNRSGHDTPNGNNRNVDSIGQGYVMPRPGQDSSTNYTTAPSSMPVLQTDQLAQLASSLYGQMRQSTGEDIRHQPENSYRTSQNSNISSELMPSQYGQGQQHQYMPNMPGPPNPNSQMNQQEEDPQTRLQATLQLAATLLQQIQGKGT